MVCIQLYTVVTNVFCVCSDVFLCLPLPSHGSILIMCFHNVSSLIVFVPKIHWYILHIHDTNTRIRYVLQCCILFLSKTKVLKKYSGKYLLIFYTILYLQKVKCYDAVSNTFVVAVIIFPSIYFFRISFQLNFILHVPTVFGIEVHFFRISFQLNFLHFSHQFG